MNVLLAVLRLGAAAAGLILCYGALFLYETEQRLVESKLEELWIRIDDLQIVMMRRHLAFLRVTAEVTSRFLERLFGHKLFSLRLMTVSACLSFVSLLLVSRVIGVIITLVTIHNPLRLLHVAKSVLGRQLLGGAALTDLLLNRLLEPYDLGMRLLAVAAAGAVFAQYVSARLRLLPLVVVSVIGVLLGLNGTTDAFAVLGSLSKGARLEAGGAIVLMALGVGVVSDIIAIAALRALLRAHANATSVYSMILFACLELAIGVALLAVPVWIGSKISGSDSWHYSLAVGANAAITTNLLSIVLTSAFAVAAVTLVS